MAMPGGGPRFRLKLNSSFELCRLYIFLIVNCSLILPKVNSYGVTASAGFGNDDNGKIFDKIIYLEYHKHSNTSCMYIQLRKYYLERIGIQTSSSSVFLNLKSISFFFGLYMASFFI